MDMQTNSISGLLSLSVISLAVHQQDELKYVFNTHTEAEANWDTSSVNMSCIL